MRGHNEEIKYRSPLTEVGIDLKEGDYVLAIDGELLSGDDNPYRLLQHKTGPVVLTVSDHPEEESAREVTYPSPPRNRCSTLIGYWETWPKLRQ